MTLVILRKFSRKNFLKTLSHCTNVYYNVPRRGGNPNTTTINLEIHVEKFIMKFRRKKS